MNNAKVVSFIKSYAIYVVLLVVFLFFAIAKPAFVQPNNLFNITRQISMVGIAASGFIFVMICGDIDLSIGSQMTLFNILSGMLIVQYGVNFWVAFLIATLVNLCVGVLNGFLITTIKMPPMIGTMSVQFTIEGLSYILCQGKPFYGFPKEMAMIGQGYIGPIPIPAIIMIVMFIITSFVLNRTYFGRYFYAAGGNREAAYLSGIKVNQLRRVAYMLASFAVSVAGMVLLSRTSSAQTNAGKSFEFEVISASVLGGVSLNGGVGKVSNMIAGVCIIGVLTNGMIILGIDSYTQMVVKGLVLMIAVGYDCLSKESRNKVKKGTIAA